MRELNPVLNGVIKVNPDALSEANKADHERNNGLILGHWKHLMVLVLEVVRAKLVNFMCSPNNIYIYI